MPVLSLIYPCLTLARQCCPRKEAALLAEGLSSSEVVLRRFEIRLSELLISISKRVQESGREDEDWYWAAPILLDLHEYPKETLDWWQRPELAATWGNENRSTVMEEESRWADHVAKAKDLIRDWQEGKCALGPQPKDLAKVLSKLACAGIGNTLLRSLAMTGTVAETESIKLRDTAAKTAKTMLGLFNTPEAMAVIRGSDATEPYWIRVLDYSIDGCLQAMLDEYVHFLREGVGQGKSEDLASQAVCVELEQVVATRTSGLGVEHFDLTPGERSLEEAIRTEKMRAKFAMRLAADKDDENDKEVTRSDRVRKSFNSPFWPFILATTSVGQEGLDFHPYCHVVIHWNLPSNPVDLEQREGRVHRYKGHAVRKNLATKFGALALRARAADPWAKLFELGKANRSVWETDIVPYWVFPGPAKIERRIPALPFSREVDRISQLRKALSIYRMVFGQNRQEDLLAYLEKVIPTEEIARVRANVTLDLSPPAVCASKAEASRNQGTTIVPRER